MSALELLGTERTLSRVAVTLCRQPRRGLKRRAARVANDNESKKTYLQTRVPYDHGQIVWFPEFSMWPGSRFVGRE